MNLQKKYRWKVLHKIVKEPTIDKDGFIQLHTLIGEVAASFRVYPYLPKELPLSLFSYLPH